jgi:iron(II)-dependent oxidoreductase
MTSPIRSTTDYKFSHALTGPYLPPPGKMPGWPFAGIGHWMMDVNAASENWLRGLREWRQEHLIRIGFDDAIYRRPELKWTQRNFVHALLMVEDRFFYDAASGRYTVDRYVDDLVRRYGGIDSVLIWYIYPNIGVDDRNHFDLIDDLPGGIEGLRAVVDDFHSRGIKVFLPTMPWDNGTRPRSRTDWDIMAAHVKAVGADGINGDTYSGLPRAFFDACDAVGRPVALQPESTAQAGDHILTWNVQSWTKKVPAELVPVVAKLKWLEPRHIINIENRWSRDRNNDLQHAFFGGLGYNAWENVWGIWNQITPRDAESLRRVAAIQRQFAAHIVSTDWTPYEKTLQAGVFASRFPGTGATLWTVINRNEYEVDGPQIALAHAAGSVYYDVWNGVRLEPRIEGGRATCALTLEARGFGGILAVEPEVSLDGFEAFLTRMRELAAKPLQSFSAEWRALAQRLIAIEPTKRLAETPPGMVRIPAAEFDFAVQGNEIEGQTWAGLDVQYPWEDSARRGHFRRMTIESFCIDRHPVTNAEFKKFVDAKSYAPRDARNFLRHWKSGAPPAGWERKPVVWVSLEDARAYAAWALKRLPHEWEWQYAAQGTDGRLYPWGNEWNPAFVPAPQLGREMPVPDDVDAHASAASPFGVLDLVGNVWQWTDEFVDDHTRAAVLRGGSAYQPQTSHWYFPQAYRLDQHGKLLLMAPCKDRSAGIGFRCVVDAI